MRGMLDSTDPMAIPAGYPMVAGYVDGLFGPDHLALGSAQGWDAAGWARFPSSTKVEIACFASTNRGHVLDVEKGNASPEQAVDWVLMRRAEGWHPTVYCSGWPGIANTVWQACKDAFNARGVPYPLWWVAQWPAGFEPADKTIPADCIAHQYAGSAWEGHHYDASVVNDYWPDVDPLPTPTPAPPPNPPPPPLLPKPMRLWIIRGGDQVMPTPDVCTLEDALAYAAQVKAQALAAHPDAAVTVTVETAV